ncbi:polysaccharide lyase family 8 super-sandwich domain-containing protein [Actinosynnema mirum]|uniref:Polysaccharide lyase family 8 n=1 Tax=Actinosynnema mirum (strain ATCC 29888 / DSM 43827 / JCM 3225 / NBRC 14064 / NCIMB 13271 / NRRL B-12336 / IMRU 3971 / 101) TaxID=446462 RepID=C6WI16_ACTMD|nr:polysaccharide lyase family 8 super-sandwich domain-containing protein [Actinosynnema mirum]ACU34467.1 polysaccharide lyase family 8 [Actinosynnema mirum DSM 43827]
MSDLDVVRARLRPPHQPGPGLPPLPDGTWADIDYADHDAADFPPLEHLRRALSLPDGQRLKALEAWRRLAPRSDNWWYNEIGAPRLVGDALLGADLDRAQRATWGTWLAEQAGPVPMTGQNLVWAQGIELRRGLVEDDPELVRRAVARMSEVLRTGDGEGIQEDLSFHQHGPQLYSGGYGASLVADLALWVRAVHGTPWAFGAAEVRLLADFLVDGQQWAVHGGGFDFTTMGREIARADAHHRTADLRAAVLRLLECDPPRTAELTAFDDRLAGHGAPLVGTRWYPRSDYLVHRRPGWSLSVRMSSGRTVPTECLNGENLLGRHLGDGVAALRLGDQAEDGYRSVLPVWDWARLPGVTTEQGRSLRPRPDQPRGGGEAIGWSDGENGVAALRLAGVEGFTEGWKTWFCFADAVVALGAGITAPDAVGPVVTTIDQRLADHGSVTYVPMTTGHFSGVERRTGSWRDLSGVESGRPVEADVFVMGFDHGPRPENASYACLIAPGDELPEVEVLANRVDRQAVRCGSVVLERSMAG